jgi:hypothetical protein
MGHLVSVVLDGGGGGEIGLARDRAEGDPGG